MNNKTVSPGEDAANIMRSLRTPPKVSWPAVIIMFSALLLIAGTSLLCYHGMAPLWAGAIVNSIAMYMLFTPAHDSMHRSASSNAKLNELIMAVSTFVVIPFGTGRFLRVMHMHHHRFTNEDNDPDHALASQLKFMPLWGFWPFVYLYTFARARKDYPSIDAVRTWRETAVGLGIISVLFYFQPTLMLWLWLIPIYVGFFLMCLVFMVLPHYPHAVRESVDPYQASLMRLGQEWLLTPILMYQNYHLMHHLYPTVPFYRYGRAWRTRLAYHQSMNPGIVSPFGLGPKALQES